MRSVKNFILISLIIIMQTMHIHAQTQKMNLTKAPQNLTELFSFIKEKYGYRFFYSNDLVKPDQKVALSSGEYILPDLLKELSAKTGLSFSMKENNLIVVEDSNKQPVVSGVISGIVTDSGTGATIPGATIMVLGTKEGIVSNMDGNLR